MPIKAIKRLFQPSAKPTLPIGCSDHLSSNSRHTLFCSLCKRSNISFAVADVSEDYSCACLSCDEDLFTFEVYLVDSNNNKRYLSEIAAELADKTISFDYAKWRNNTPDNHNISYAGYILLQYEESGLAA